MTSASGRIQNSTEPILFVRFARCVGPEVNWFNAAVKEDVELNSWVKESFHGREAPEFLKKSVRRKK